MTHDFSQLLSSVIDPEQLRVFSPAAARWLVNDADLAGLDPLIDDWKCAEDIARARRALFVQCAEFERQGGNPLEAAQRWSDFADLAIGRAALWASDEIAEKYGPPQLEGEAIEFGIFALGKLGSNELNPSSDIDLLIVYERDGDVSDDLTAHQWFVRFTRAFSRVLDGSVSARVFRVDLDLRPEGRTGPLANSLDGLERYYERFGRTWERGALTRLRNVSASDAFAQRVLNRLRPFVYPRSTRGKTTKALYEMKESVADSVRLKGEGTDLKRGRGGIRDVEFIVMVFQLLYAGKNEHLRFGSTLDLLARCESEGFISHTFRQTLTDAYVEFRRLEHALQYREDRQTHFLSDDDPLFLESEVATLQDQVHAIFQEVFGEEDDALALALQQKRTLARHALSGRNEDSTRRDALTSLGFEEADAVLALLETQRQRRGSPFSKSLSKDGEIRSLAVEWLLEAGRSQAPSEVMRRSVDLFQGYFSHASLRTLSASPATLRQLILVLAKSESLSRMIPKKWGALFSEPVQRPPSRVGLNRAFKREVEQGGNASSVDDEDTLLWMRRVNREEVLRAGISFLSEQDGVVSGHRLSTLADAMLERAVYLARVQVERKIQRPKGARFVVAALGRLGGRELGFLADLDVAFFFDADDIAAAAHWAAKIAQRAMSALSVQMQNGRCYEIDARLRPSGNQGALVSSLKGFERYHAGRSQVWERQALLRLRPVTGDTSLMHELRSATRKIVSQAPEGGGGETPNDAGANSHRARASISFGF